MRLPLPLCMTVWGRVAEQAWVERPQFPHPPPPFQGWGFRLGGVMHWRNTARPNFEMGGAGVRKKKQFTELVSDNSNFTLLNVMSNICYKKFNKDQKGLGVFMDVLFKSCEK